MKQVFTYLIIILFIFGLNSCIEKKTQNPTLAYKWWVGEKPPKEIEVLKAMYWESSHWSKEYIAYLTVKAPTSWIKEFISVNKLVPVKNTTIISKDIPSWFKPPGQCKIFSKTDPGDNSSYYYDSVAHQFWIYEIQN